MNVRRVCVEDAAIVESLFNSMNPENRISISRRDIIEINKDTNTLVFVLENNAAIIGTVQVNICRSLYNSIETFLLIENLVTLRDSHAADLLIKECIKTAMAYKCVRVRFQRYPEDEYVQCIFRNNGFKLTENKEYKLKL